MRPIDADALMREVEKAEKSMERHGREFSCSFLSSSQEISTEWYFVEQLIDNAPTIEAKPVKHGKWLKTAQSLVFPEKFRNYFCSECGLELDKSIKAAFRYCPNCGAKMDEVEK